MPNLRKLNIACGKEPIEGYINLDKYPQEDHKVLLADAYYLPFKDEVFDEILSSHFLEHIPFLDIWPMLVEWKRTLRSGGVLKICVPDMKMLAIKWLQSSVTQKIDFLEGAIFGSKRGTGPDHYCGLDMNILAHLLTQSGYSTAKFYYDKVWDFWLWAEVIK